MHWGRAGASVWRRGPPAATGNGVEVAVAGIDLLSNHDELIVFCTIGCSKIDFKYQSDRI